MKITTSKTRPIAIIAGVFLLCLCAGIISGSYLKDNTNEADAASANIEVQNNNQEATEDQGTTTITRTSTITIKDPNATIGYNLYAQLSQNSIPPTTTVTIYPETLPQSPTTSPCTQSTPCNLSTNPTTPTKILETATDISNQPQGDTTTWRVTITLPANTPRGSYILDIAYTEDFITPPPSLQSITNMQDATSAMCSSTPMGTTVNLKDTRDNKYYRVRKMADNRCWMIDNLAYQLLQNDTGTAPNAGAPAFSPSAQILSNGMPTANNRAQYAQNNNTPSQGQIPNNGNPTPSYLYNWCAAMGDTSTNCATTLAYTAGQPSTPQTGICPAPFRLPMVGTTPAPSIPPNGSNQAEVAATTTNEFAKLDIWLGGTGSGRLNANTYTNLTSDNNTNPQLFFSGALSGYYGTGFGTGFTEQGSDVRWWSSTVVSPTSAYALYLYSLNATVSPMSGNSSFYGFAVRCIL